MIRTFADIEPAHRDQVGAKAYTLARLRQQGYRVPNGFVITSGAFRDDGLTEAAWQAVNRQIAVTASANGRFPLAVRSSARSEDAVLSSYAGEFETILDVHDAESLRRAIDDVYRSRFNERVQAYTAARGESEEQEIAVIVQQMVPAEFAGVLFTANPLNGSHIEMVGNFVNGLGDGLVSGDVTGEAFTLRYPSGRYEGPKRLRPYARRLFKMAKKLVETLGGPQDIEWAVVGGKLYLLQSRPVTTLQRHDPTTGDWNDSRRGDYLWTNSNLGEALPNVMSPLTWSLVQLYVEEVGVTLPGNHPFMGNIGGRFYMNVTAMASMLQGLGFSKKRINKESEEFFGRLPEHVQIPIIPFSRWSILHVMLPIAWKVQGRRRRRLAGLDAFVAGLPAQAAALKQRIKAADNPVALAELWQDELDPLLRLASRMLQTGTSRYENAYRPLRRRLQKQVGEESAITLLSGVSRHGDYLSSLGPLLGLWRMSQGNMSRAQYVEAYGHRGADELEVSLPHPAEDPGWIDTQLTNLAEADVAGLLAEQQQKHAAAWDAYARQFPRQASKMKQKLEQAATFARGREAVRSEFTRVYGLARAFALRAGVLTGLGEEVFFFSTGELIAVLRGDDTAVSLIPARREMHERLQALPPYPSLINGRFDPFAWAADPQRRHDIFDAHAPSSGGKKGDISGYPASPGLVEGRVRLLHQPDQGGELQPGEILVAQTTNIGWTPLFPRAAAIVTDVGAPLSHAAIVARELGITAVVGCSNATSLLDTGDLVRVDGNLGVVEIIGKVADNQLTLSCNQNGEVRGP